MRERSTSLQPDALQQRRLRSAVSNPLQKAAGGGLEASAEPGIGERYPPCMHSQPLA
jgi:hypothetical protein